MSYANSKIPTSAQQGVHERLPQAIQRHREQPFLKPLQEYNRASFVASLAGHLPGQPIILDAGCGVAHSTIELARRYPDHWVIGVDQSADRLMRKKPYPAALLPGNMALVRADLVDYWRLFYASGRQLARHYMLYPNPWPKIGHLGRRWPAHPVFPYVLACGGILECRSNWQVYIDEFVVAVHGYSAQKVISELFFPDQTLTPFERKYRDSGQDLWRAVVDLQQCQTPVTLALPTNNITHENQHV